MIKYINQIPSFRSHYIIVSKRRSVLSFDWLTNAPTFIINIETRHIDARPIECLFRGSLTSKLPIRFFLINFQFAERNLSPLLFLIAPYSKI